MKKTTKKMIAPIVIVTLLCLYYLGIGIFFLCIDGASLFTRLLAVIIPAILSVVAVVVLVERIKEIKKGDSDDLSKY